MADRKLTVTITGDSSSARRALNEVDDTAGKTGTSITAKLKGSLSSLSGFGSALAGGLLGGGLVAGFTGLQSAVSGVVSEYQESVKVGRETERVIRTTGGAANVTAGFVEDLAQKLSEKRGVDDELIQSGANLLLTFKNVRNETGKGNDVFTQAVKISGDMSTSLGISMPSASKLLGKALNDPAKGMAKLAKITGELTPELQQQVKAHVLVGDTLGAQKLILEQLGERYKGAAEAAATPIDKIKVKLANLQESVGTFFAEKAMPWIAEMWPEVQAKVEAGINRVREIIEPALEVISVLWDQFGDNILNFAEGAFNAIKDVVQGALDIIQGIVDVVLGLITGDWDKAWKGVQEIVRGVWEVIKGIVDAAVNWVKWVIGIAWDTIQAVAGAAWDKIAFILGAAWEGIKSVVSGGVDEIVGFVEKLPGRIGGFVWAMVEAGASLGRAVIDGIKGGISAAAQFAGDIANGILEAFKRGWNHVARVINDFIPDRVGFDTPFGFIGVDLPNNPLPTFHSGGVVPGPPGAEILALLQAGERVIPARQVAAAGGGGGNTYSITVNVAPGGSPADTGRAVVETIKEYERRAGSSWRN